ncbi:MAG TPA: sulfatase [Kiritimatiellia bacterium]|nr:sulfatase [Kiritimatiellia bacterium]
MDISHQPNIVFILIDDLGCRDLASFGSTFYETPRLDALAARGMRFEHAYAACPVCSPTRASIMSGKYPARVGITQWIGGKAEGKLKDVPYLHYLPREETSLATALREGGYQTWHVGKWHLGGDPCLPEQHGFDINIGGGHYGGPGPNGYFAPYPLIQMPPAEPGTYLTDQVTDEAIRLIRGRAEKPFFLNLSHYAVHTPIQAPAPLVEKYRAKARAMGLDRVDPFVEGELHPCLHKKHLHVKRRTLQSDITYAAMIENLDTNIGRLIDALEAEGLMENTLLVFTSDNGGLSTSEGSPTCNLPYIEGKGWNYEGGTRVCQFIVWPDHVAAQSRCAVPVTSTDFYPTLLEAAGLPLRPAQHCDGVSLMPLLRGGDRIARDAIFWHYPHYSNQGGTPAASLVAGDWKLIEFFEDGRLELYNLADDPGEQRNLAAGQPDRAAELHARLKAWQAGVEARIPEPNPDYERMLLQPATPSNAYE